MCSPFALVSARPFVAPAILIRQRFRTWSVLSTLHTFAMGAHRSRAPLQHTSAARIGSATVPLADQIVSDGKLPGSDGSLGLQEAGSTVSNSGKAKRKVALHVAYCGTGYQGKYIATAAQSSILNVTDFQGAPTFLRSLFHRPAAPKGCRGHHHNRSCPGRRHRKGRGHSGVK